MFRQQCGTFDQWIRSGKVQSQTKNLCCFLMTSSLEYFNYLLRLSSSRAAGASIASPLSLH